MEISVILQIITVVVSIVLLIATYFFDSKINKRHRTISSIAQERMNKLTKLRQACSTIWSLTEPNYIIEQIQSNKKFNIEKNKTYTYELNKAKNICKTHTFPFFSQEKHLQESADELIKFATMYYKKQSKALVDKINEKREEFFTEASLYTWAMWKFIVKQADGNKHIGSEFARMYDELLLKVKSFDEYFEVTRQEGLKKVYKKQKQEKDK